MQIDQLKEKAYVNAPVYLDKNYIILSPDIPVTGDLRKRLNDWGYREVATKGRVVSSPSTSVLDGVAFSEKSFKESEKQRAAEQFMDQTAESLSRIFERFREKDELKINDVTEVVKNILQGLRTQKRYILGLTESEMDKENYLARNSVRTAIFILVMAATSKMPLHRQIDVGIAALLHEIGMLRLPLNLVEKSGDLSEQERRALQAHPVLGFRILKEAGFPGPISLAILEHHEFIDGSGYPRGIKGNQISAYGKMLCVATAYNAAVSPRSYKTAKDAHMGLMDVIKFRGIKYDEQVISLLVLSMSFYPVGTFVLLSDGTKAKVVKTTEQGPRNPVVCLLADKDDKLIPDQPVLQIRENDPVKIERALSRVEAEPFTNPLTIDQE